MARPSAPLRPRPGLLTEDPLPRNAFLSTGSPGYHKFPPSAPPTCPGPAGRRSLLACLKTRPICGPTLPRPPWGGAARSRDRSASATGPLSRRMPPACSLTVHLRAPLLLRQPRYGGCPSSRSLSETAASLPCRWVVVRPPMAKDGYLSFHFGTGARRLLPVSGHHRFSPSSAGWRAIALLLSGARPPAPPPGPRLSSPCSRCAAPWVLGCRGAPAGAAPTLPLPERAPRGLPRPRADGRRRVVLAVPTRVFAAEYFSNFSLRSQHGTSAAPPTSDRDRRRGGAKAEEKAVGQPSSG